MEAPTFRSAGARAELVKVRRTALEVLKGKKGTRNKLLAIQIFTGPKTPLWDRDFKG
jgi:hypothetical protein